MRGQKLLIRPLLPSDAQAVQQLLGAFPDASVPSGETLIARLVGDLVAVLSYNTTTDAVLITRMTVRSDLQRKRIGTFLLDELTRRTAEENREWIVVTEVGDAGDFFRKYGFHDSNGTMRKRVAG